MLLLYPLLKNIQSILASARVPEPEICYGPSLEQHYVELESVLEFLNSLWGLGTE
jgi:hypothetical protein